MSTFNDGHLHEDMRNRRNAPVRPLLYMKGINTKIGVWNRLRLIVETKDDEYSILVNHRNFKTALQREMKQQGVVLIKLQEGERVRTLFQGGRDGKKENNR